MTTHAYVTVGLGTVLWALPFPLIRSKSKQQSAAKLDPRARWGVALQTLGYTVLWQGQFWLKSLAAWQLELAILLFAVAGLLSWTSALALGKEFRVDAALIQNHRLVRSGPYGIVRHPIYASMLSLLLATGILIAPWYLLVAGLALFLVGTEIRTHVEDKLLESRFGDEFREYRRAVKGLLPLVR